MMRFETPVGGKSVARTPTASTTSLDSASTLSSQPTTADRNHFSVDVSIDEPLPQQGAVHFKVRVFAVATGNDWCVHRRYSAFEALQSKLWWRLGPHVLSPGPRFPPKFPPPGYSPSALAERASSLQAWAAYILGLQDALDIPDVLSFFGLPAFQELESRRAPPARSRPLEQLHDLAAVGKGYAARYEQDERTAQPPVLVLASAPPDALATPPRPRRAPAYALAALAAVSLLSLMILTSAGAASTTGSMARPSAAPTHAHASPIHPAAPMRPPASSTPLPAFDESARKRPLGNGPLRKHPLLGHLRRHLGLARHALARLVTVPRRRAAAAARHALRGARPAVHHLVTKHAPWLHSLHRTTS
jgi:hypothetical protein